MTNYFYKNDLPENINFGKSIAIDTEALGLKNRRDRLCLIQIYSIEKNDCYIVQFEKDRYEAVNLRKLLTDKKIEKLMHFARFDMAIIYNAMNIMMENIYCTKIASKIARTYTDAHGLKVLIKEFLGFDISKKEQSSYWGGEITEEQLKYAGNDVLYLHKIKDSLEKILINEDRKHYVEECFKFLPTRIKLDLAGWEDTDIFSH